MRTEAYLRFSELRELYTLLGRAAGSGKSAIVSLGNSHYTWPHWQPRHGFWVAGTVWATRVPESAIKITDMQFSTKVSSCKALEESDSTLAKAAGAKGNLQQR